MEDRRLLAVGVVLVVNDLQVKLDAVDDTAKISVDGTDVVVKNGSDVEVGRKAIASVNEINVSGDADGNQTVNFESLPTLSKGLSVGGAIENVNLGADILTDGGDVDIDPVNAIVLTANVTIDTDESGGVGNAGEVTLGDVDGTTAGADDLSVDATADGGGQHGVIALNGRLGASVALGNVHLRTGSGIPITATIEISGAQIQTDGGNVTLEGSVIVNAGFSIDTETGDDGDAGNVDLTSAPLYVASPAIPAWVLLSMIDTSTGASFHAGSVALGSGYTEGGSQLIDGQPFVLFTSPFGVPVYVSQASLSSLDYGDAPYGYPVLQTDNGASHVVGDLYLGNAVDGERDGNPTFDATGDDNDRFPDDEDGVAFNGGTTIFRGDDFTFTVTASQANGWLRAWLDLDGDGTWETAERIVDTQMSGTTETVTASELLTGTIPASVHNTYLRVRLSAEENAGGQNPDGADSAVGEVEDYLLAVDELFADFGDAPFTSGLHEYGTLLADDGPRHQISGNSLYLGASRDQEPDGIPTADADGDDKDFIDDENGVRFLTPLIPGESAQVEVTASEDGWLHAWIDFKTPGTSAVEFDAVADKLFGGARFLPAGTHVLSFQVPNDSTSGDTYARFRLSSLKELGPKGSAPDGEVEDYQVTVTSGPTVTIEQEGTQNDPTNSSPINFTATFSEAVTGFATGDVDLTGSTAPGTLVGTVTGSNTTYNVEVSGMTGSGDVVASIPSNVAADSGGRPNSPSTSTDNTVVYNKPAVEEHFDFGEVGSPVETGYTGVTKDTGYTAALAHGWLNTRVVNDRDRGAASGTALTRDLDFTRDGTFVVDVPNGNYEVSMVLGDRGPYWHDQMGIYLEGSLVHTVARTDPGEVTATLTFTAAVTDGQMTLRLKDLGGTDPYVCIQWLDVSST